MYGAEVLGSFPGEVLIKSDLERIIDLARRKVESHINGVVYSFPDSVGGWWNYASSNT